MAVPLVMLFAVVAVQVRRSTDDVAEVREQANLATASIGPSGVINAVMNERNYTSLWLYGVESSIDLPVDSLEDARADTDASVAAFEDEVERRGGEAAEIYAPGRAALDDLAEIRDTVDGYEGPRNPTAKNWSGEVAWYGYTDIVTTLADATAEIGYQVRDQQLRRGVQLVDQAVREVEDLSQIVRMGTIRAIRIGNPLTHPAYFSRGVEMVTGADRRHQRILDLTSGPYARFREDLEVESEATGIFEIEREFVETGMIDIGGLLNAVSIEEDESYYGFIHDVSGVIRSRADGLIADAEAGQRRMLILAGFVLVTAIAGATIVARSITRPLRSLTAQAEDMAKRRLPWAVRQVHETPLGHDVTVPRLDPVSVKSRDEVAEVAEVLNAVQSTALDLAVEQAVLRRNIADAFVNLVRRNQGLVTRQLDFITELESGETRPEVLADLFNLDHHATRLRRNAESLLVLAGVAPHRHATEPANVGDVVRSALGEITGFERVTVKGLQPAAVDGPAVADLTHLLAELIENALRFSPEGETVEVRGHGVSDGYELAVIDRGPGMSPEELTNANRRLANAEAHTIAPSKYLGHYVSAVLASRHRIAVTLAGGPTTGITATIHLSATLMSEAIETTSETPVVPASPAEARPARLTSRAAARRPAPAPSPASAPAPVPAPAEPVDPNAPIPMVPRPLVPPSMRLPSVRIPALDPAIITDPTLDPTRDPDEPPTVDAAAEPATDEASAPEYSQPK